VQKRAAVIKTRELLTTAKEVKFIPAGAAGA
jgi:hypothetical protein